ncbi:TetR/AcrR family transcriptional regulator [Ulvibacterium sp.]|uniref:TetR/AcrR family transcriptional regulator n=1 Tax=Ulvibacterium sp. TaxID=2665914 RepID=UPI00261C0683|nr:TetR/AcrR family transcriptional regulator [Ulvibacterium sp.]
MKHSEIRQHIINTASDLFYANGYNNTGINEIIAKAGIAKATLYNHFRTKDDICIAYLKHKHSNFILALRSYIEEKPKGRLQLLGIFDFLKEFYREPSFNGCWCIRTIAEIPGDNVEIRNEIQNQKKELVFFLKEVVNDNIKNLSNAEAEKITNGLYLLYEGAVGESHLHQSDWPIYSARDVGAQLIP